MEIDIKDLLYSIRVLKTSGTRISCPDDPTSVEIADLQNLISCLDKALGDFRKLRGGGDYLVSVEINAFHRSVGIRFVQHWEPGNRCEDWGGQVDPSLEMAFQDLCAVAAKSAGTFSYWGGNNFLDLVFPFNGPVSEAFLDVQHLPWDDIYRHQLERESWPSLRNMAFRFANLAEAFAAQCVESKMSRVLIPSVGLCVHPWLFADHGLSVVATDAAKTAVGVLSEPEHWPRLYSIAAFERWDITEAARFGTHGHPHQFARMPNLENRTVRESLRQHIAFILSDWAEIPLENGGVDAIFATNALPRDSFAEQYRVLNEWARVVRRGGIVLIAQHNFFDSDIESVLQDAGWVEANILGGDRPTQPYTTGFQIRYSSG